MPIDQVVVPVDRRDVEGKQGPVFRVQTLPDVRQGIVDETALQVGVRCIDLGEVFELIDATNQRGQSPLAASKA